MDRDEIVSLPAGVTDADAAALGLSAIAAYMALTWRGQFRPEDRVLVLGAGGVVGQVAVQVAAPVARGSSWRPAGVQAPVSVRSVREPPPSPISRTRTSTSSSAACGRRPEDPWTS